VRLWRFLFGVKVPGYKRWWTPAPCASGIWCYRWDAMSERDFRCGGPFRWSTCLIARRTYYRKVVQPREAGEGGG
jgi:hypothetical protein